VTHNGNVYSAAWLIWHPPGKVKHWLRTYYHGHGLFEAEFLLRPQEQQRFWRPAHLLRQLCHLAWLFSVASSWSSERRLKDIEDVLFWMLHPWGIIIHANSNAVWIVLEHVSFFWPAFKWTIIWRTWVGPKEANCNEVHLSRPLSLVFLIVYVFYQVRERSLQAWEWRFKKRTQNELASQTGFEERERVLFCFIYLYSHSHGEWVNCWSDCHSL